MVGISRLYLGAAASGDRLRYARQGVHSKPVVVWNVTRACNLSCVHCYASALKGRPAEDELSRSEALGLVDSLADYGVPVLLLSGGEPFMRPDVMDIASRARSRGMGVTFSTNGTLIDGRLAREIARLKVGYVGVSIDGGEKMHDSFRGMEGAYGLAVDAIGRLLAEGVRTGLRVTLTKANVDALPEIFALVRKMRIPRICLYHLVPSGRGAGIKDMGLGVDSTRAALETILAETVRSHASGHPVEVLTVDNPSDGPWLVERMERGGNPRAAEARELLTRNGGSSSGTGIAAISWDGSVYPDQFSRTRPVGSVRERPFAEIWDSPPEGSILFKYRNRSLLPAKCLSCKWLQMCGGSFRARAEAATGSLSGEDPSCVAAPSDSLFTRDLGRN